MLSTHLLLIQTCGSRKSHDSWVLWHPVVASPCVPCCRTPLWRPLPACSDRQRYRWCGQSWGPQFPGTSPGRCASCSGHCSHHSNHTVLSQRCKCLTHIKKKINKQFYISIQSDHLVKHRYMCNQTSG